MNWKYTSLSDYPQKQDICLVETNDSYKLLWYNERNKWWYYWDTDEPYAKSTKIFKWVYLEDILENIE